jgi:hypothetical protein
MQVVKVLKISEKVYKTVQFAADTFTIVDQFVLVPTSYIMCALANDLVSCSIRAELKCKDQALQSTRTQQTYNQCICIRHGYITPI